MDNDFYFKNELDNDFAIKMYWTMIFMIEMYPTNVCSGYDTKQPNGKALLPLIPCPLRLAAIGPDRVLSIGQIELFDI